MELEIAGARPGGMNLPRRLVGSPLPAAAMMLALLLVAGCTGPPGSSAAASVGSGSSQVVSGRATASPTCPVERNPPDPACAPRPVGGAVLVIQTAAGVAVLRVTTDQNGRFSVALAPGGYRLVPQPVAGFMGGARPLIFTVRPAQTLPALEVSYDTGIR